MKLSNRLEACSEILWFTVSHWWVLISHVPLHQAKFWNFSNSQMNTFVEIIKWLMAEAYLTFLHHWCNTSTRWWNLRAKPDVSKWKQPTHSWDNSIRIWASHNYAIAVESISNHGTVTRICHLLILDEVSILNLPDLEPGYWYNDVGAEWLHDVQIVGNLKKACTTHSNQPLPPRWQGICSHQSFVNRRFP